MDSEQIAAAQPARIGSGNHGNYYSAAAENALRIIAVVSDTVFEIVEGFFQICEHIALQSVQISRFYFAGGTFKGPVRLVTAVPQPYGREQVTVVRRPCDH